MIDLYKKYYPDDDKLKNMLECATIIFDTSALLDLYYYSQKTREEIFEKVFAYLKNRLYIPAQVYFEYLKNKSLVSSKPINVYRNLISKSDKAKDGGYIDRIVELAKKIDNDIIHDIYGQLHTLKENTAREDKHPYLDTSVYEDIEHHISDFEVNVMEFIKQVKDFKECFEIQIDNRIRELNDVIVDSVYDAIKKHFQVGQELKYSEMLEIAKEGAFRYEEKIPPGYKDSDNKIGLQKYGDLFVWKQILEYTQKNRKDVIFVINDLKEDWVEADKKRPRFELLKEFNAEANKTIWLMPMSSFLYQINNVLDAQLDENTITDVEIVMDNREKSDIPEGYILEAVQRILSMVLQEDIYVIDNIFINNTIRLFEKPIIYDAEDELGQKYRIVVTVVSGGNYAKILHSMTNAIEIKKFYESNGEDYSYYNFIIMKNRELMKRFEEHLLKPKIKKYFNNEKIKNVVCCYDNEEIDAYKTNFSQG